MPFSAAAALAVVEFAARPTLPVPHEMYTATPTM